MASSMALRSSGRKLSFDIFNGTDSIEDVDDLLMFYRSNSDHIRNDDHHDGGAESGTGKRKKKKRNKNKKKHLVRSSSMPEGSTADSSSLTDSNSVPIDDDFVITESRDGCELDVDLQSGVYTINEVAEEFCNFGELRQRNVNGGGSTELMVSHMFEGNEEEEDKGGKEREKQFRRMEPIGSVLTKLETADSLDWKRLMAEDPNFIAPVESSPVKYFIGEMYAGNSLRQTVALGNDKERERVYDTIFRLPWRCELLIDVGFFVCLDSFLSLLTIMPTRVLIIFWRLIRTRQFTRPSAAELSDIGCFVALTCGVALLVQTDISLIYHMIRGQGTIKLYVVYNVLEIFDKLFQNFGGDVLQTLFNSAEELASCSAENTTFWTWRFISDQVLATVSSILHSFVLLAQAVTLSTCIIAHNNALLALLVSNNFAEIKGSVFKRFNTDNIHSLVYSDSIERLHISAFLVFVLAQNILEAEGPWLEIFLYNAFLVFMCEVFIDIIKHSFLAKFNDIKPSQYSEFLEELCKQTLNIQNDDKKRKLTFVPLAPACVVIRVLTPVYAARLPYSPLGWRLVWIFLLSAVTYVMLATVKLMVGIGLQKHAKWYVNRCEKRKFHAD